MCGISVVVDARRPARHPTVELLAPIHRALAHRGPDGERVLLVDDALATATVYASTSEASRAPRAPCRVAAGFRRLAIQDPSPHAMQPLAGRGRTWLLFNGEIYNQVDLREALRARGAQFRTSNDAEVVAAAYAEWGEACVERFNGMFALLVLDLERRILFGARDRLGIKPLYWLQDDDRLLFASEPAALARVQRTARPDPEQLGGFLSGLPPLVDGRTMYAAIRTVPAASRFSVSLDRPAEPEFEPFWSLDAVTPPRSYADAVGEVGALLKDSMALQLRSHATVGTLLSGGLDSSLLTRMAATRSTSDVAAFSVIHRDPRLSEVVHQWAVVRQGGVRHHTVEFTPGLVWERTDDVVRSQGQPLLGQEVIAQDAVYRLAREHGVTVILDGQGADEMLAGLPGFSNPFLLQLAATGRFAELAREIMASAAREGGSRIGMARGALFPRPSPAKTYPWLEPRHSAALEDAWRSDVPDLNRYLRSLIVRTNLPVVLQYQDRASMAHGVESRVPYLDHRFVELCHSLQPEWKVHRGVRKRVLRDVARGVVPDSIIDRRDCGAFVSSARYLDVRRMPDAARAGMSEFWRDATVDGVDGARVNAFVAGYMAGRHDDAAAVWRLYTASRWMSQAPFTAGAM